MSFCRLGTLVVLFGLFCLEGFGQVQRVVHQGIELRDLPARIRLDTDTTYKAENWPMSGILIESKVMIYECKQKILDYLIEAGRYELDTITQDQTLHVVVDTGQEPITVAGGGCHEEVERKFYMPVGFYLDSLGYWRNPDMEVEIPLEANSPERDTLPVINGNRE